MAFAAPLWSQTTDSTINQKNSLQIEPVADTTDSVKAGGLVQPVFKLKNKLLNAYAEPVSLAVQKKKVASRDIIFYMIAVVAFSFF